MPFWQMVTLPRLRWALVDSETASPAWTADAVFVIVAITRIARKIDEVVIRSVELMFIILVVVALIDAIAC